MKLRIGQRVKFKDCGKYNPWSGVDAVVESISEEGMIWLRKGTVLNMNAERGGLTRYQAKCYIILPSISLENK